MTVSAPAWGRAAKASSTASRGCVTRSPAARSSVPRSGGGAVGDMPPTLPGSLERVKNTPAPGEPSARVELADHVLDVGLLDRQVGHVVGRGDGGDDRGGARVRREGEPLARPLAPLRPRARYVDRGHLVDQVDDQGPGRAALLVQAGQVSVEDGRAVVDHDDPAAQRLDVLE